MIVGLACVVAGYSLYDFEPEPAEADFKNATFHTNGSQTSWALLEVADNDTERKNGLMNRTELGKNEGMLFVFSQEDERTFWMKNTLIPLDIIYLDSERTVVDIDTAYPELNTSEDNLARYPSDRPAKYVVEVNAGFAENNSIRKGSKVEWGRR